MCPFRNRLQDTLIPDSRQPIVSSASTRRRRKCYKALSTLSTGARFSSQQVRGKKSGCGRSGYKTHTPDSLFVTVPQVDAKAEVVPKHIAQAGDL